MEAKLNCNHRSISGGYATLSHSFPNGEIWLRCVRCDKTWKKGIKAGQWEPPTEDTADFEKVKSETDLFLKENPDYYPCHHNFQAMVEYVKKHDLKPDKEGFKAAFVGICLEGVYQKKPTSVTLEEQTVKNKLKQDFILAAYKMDDIASTSSISISSPVACVEAIVNGKTVKMYLTPGNKEVIQSKPVVKEVQIVATETTRRIKEYG